MSGGRGLALAVCAGGSDLAERLAVEIGLAAPPRRPALGHEEEGGGRVHVGDKVNFVLIRAQDLRGCVLARP